MPIKVHTDREPPQDPTLNQLFGRESFKMGQIKSLEFVRAAFNGKLDKWLEEEQKQLLEIKDEIKRAKT